MKCVFIYLFMFDVFLCLKFFFCSCLFLDVTFSMLQFLTFICFEKVFVYRYFFVYFCFFLIVFPENFSIFFEHFVSFEKTFCNHIFVTTIFSKILFLEKNMLKIHFQKYDQIIVIPFLKYILKGIQRCARFSGYKNMFETKMSVSRRRRIAQMLQQSQSLLLYCNVVQTARLVFYRPWIPHSTTRWWWRADDGSGSESADLV